MKTRNVIIAVPALELTKLRLNYHRLLLLIAASPCGGSSAAMAPNRLLMFQLRRLAFIKTVGQGSDLSHAVARHDNY